MLFRSTWKGGINLEVSNRKRHFRVSFSRSGKEQKRVHDLLPKSEISVNKGQLPAGHTLMHVHRPNIVQASKTPHMK